MRRNESFLTNLDGPYAIVGIECECGHEFWWDTSWYGPKPMCANCDREYTIMVTLTVKEDES